MRAVFSVGSNLGDRLANLRTAYDVLAGYGDVRASPVYETRPVGGPEQGDYLNAVLIVDLPAGTDLLAMVAAAEGAAGRRRGPRWGPRTLDLDVVSVDRVVSDDPALTLPHPRAAERAFVLAPWLDLDPAAELPGAGEVPALLARLGREGVRRRDDLPLAAG